MESSNSAIKFMIYFIIVFGFLAIGTELFRIVKLTVDIKDSFQIILEDAIELAVEDEYRKDHVTILRPGECEENFESMLRDKYNLDYNFSPIGDSYFASPFIFESFDVNIGSYHVDEVRQRAVQDEGGHPSARVKGYVEVKPLVIGVDANIKIPFNIYAESKRTD